MTNRSLIFVSNWKMQLSFDETLHFCQENAQNLLDLDASTPHRFVLCPSFCTLYPVHSFIGGTPISLGAQTCSNQLSGAFTGEISARSLAELGCTYCIVGHSERRTYFHETNEDVARKAMLLIQESVKPIICIGENQEQYKRNKTFSVLTEQLKPIFNAINSLDYLPSQLIIAYEPVWAIGSGVIPSTEYLNDVFQFLSEECSHELLTHHSCLFLYGGSVNEKTIVPMLSLDLISGFLVGGASLDFQRFKNMVSLC